MMSTALAQTPIHDWHASHGGRMVDFGGWSMPVQYTSIVEEHQATRNAVGLFDISHMGRIRFDGPDAVKFLDSLSTRRIDNLRMGQIRYSLFTKEDGGTLDDVLVYRLQDADGPFHLLVVNAGNREKILGWIQKHIGLAGNMTCADMTDAWAMIAVQGPQSMEMLKTLIDVDVATMKNYSGQTASIGDTAGIVSRTGYTGEDGCELLVPAEMATQVWQQLVTAAKEVGGLPVGLGARDTLRLEAAMPLYGHELSESISPIQAGLNFAVNLKDRSFIGCEALAGIQNGPPLPCRVGLICEGRRVPREGYPIVRGGERIGEVTSGTFSPTLEKSIAMGYVAQASSESGLDVGIDIRGRVQPATVVDLPFYRRKK